MCSFNGKICCLGAGRMGRGIAHSAAYSGSRVYLIDAKDRSDAEFEQLRAETLAEISGSLRMIADLGGFEGDAIPALMERITVLPRGEAEEGVRDAKITFEAVPEVMEAKKDAFALFDQYASETAILASTTSTILATKLAKFTAAPERFLNAHWLNPAFLVPLVEVSPCDETSENTVNRVREILEGMGKLPILCKASPGYIVPRIQALAMNEAARLVEEGVASAEDVDRAVKYGFGLRFAVLGLLEFIDWGGGDILYYASHYLREAFDDDRFKAPEIIESNMENNRIGLKTGSGFFEYAGADVDAYRKERLGAFLKLVLDAGFFHPPKL